MQGFMRLHLPHIVALEQPVQLLRRQRNDFGIEVSRPRKSLAALQHFVPHDEPIAVPPENLDAISFSAAENKKRAGEWVLSNDFLHQCGQTRALLSHINRRTVQIHPLDRLFRVQHQNPRSPAATSMTPGASSHTPPPSRLAAATLALGSTAPASSRATAPLQDAPDIAAPVPSARSASSSCSPFTAIRRDQKHRPIRSMQEIRGCPSAYRLRTRRRSNPRNPKASSFSVS